MHVVLSITSIKIKRIEANEVSKRKVDPI